MGVPGFFAWLMKNYEKKGVIMESLSDEQVVDLFYMDANCLIHPQCFKILHHLTKATSLENLEKKMIKRILNYIDYLIDVVNPKVGSYISVDGVAPQAKMDQQRKRRYRSSQDSDIKREIEKRHKKDSFSNWTNTVITPGTEFMEKLHSAIIKYINEKKDRKIIYSSYHTPGEGEHKILQDLKSSKYESFVIYGLDADLIFLSLASQRKNIFLLREADQLRSLTGQKEKSMFVDDPINDIFEELNFVSVDGIRECINEHLIGMIRKKMKEDFEDQELEKEMKKFEDKDFTNDFVFVCYLLGNDFLPHLPSVDIKTGALDFIMACYIDIYLDTNIGIIDLEKGLHINSAFLDLLLKSISTNEVYYFREILPSYLERCQKRRCPTSDPFEKELWDLENLKGERERDPIRLGDGHPRDWKYRYYYHYFKVSNYQNQLIADMCLQYLTGVRWVAKYYFESIASWDWQYPYTHAPFVSDLSRFLSESDTDLNSIEFELSEPSLPCTQLLAVLPPACVDVLPHSYRYLVTSPNSPIIDLFPTKITIDTLYKDMYWKCIPLIPIVDIKRVREITKNISLTSEEKQRNKMLEPISNSSKRS